MKKNTGFSLFDTTLPVKPAGDFSWLGFPRETRPGTMSRAALLEAIQSLTAPTTAVVLSANALGRVETPFLLEILLAVEHATSIRSLVLSRNVFNETPFDDLKLFFAHLPALDDLDLSCNKLCEAFTPSEFEVLMGMALNKVSRINLYRNGFETYPKASQEALLAAFSGKVTFISPAVPSEDETKQGLPKVL